MAIRRSISLSAVLIVACLASPAIAGQFWDTDDSDWRATHEAIYALENTIAFLEADPQTDDGYRAPIITRARAEILRLRAMLPPAEWRSINPCCYSRRPIYIR